jgi:hypothetical protein
MTATDSITTLSNSDLSGIRSLLETQRTRRLDLITHSSALSYDNGQLKIDSGEVVLTPDGVTTAGGLYVPTGVFESSFGDPPFGIPRAYTRKLRQEGRIELLDQTVNHFLHGSRDGVNAALNQKFMTRLFRGDEGTGVARALLSDKYKTVDNLDVLVTVLAGIRDAGADVSIGRCDVTESRMYVQVNCPAISALAPGLLDGYRSPFTGQTGNDIPQVFAGFVISNSETGNGAASLTPRITFKVCKNGMTINKDAMRAVHLGGRREEGIVKYSDETIEKELELVMLRTRDAVKTFLDVEYVEAQIRAMQDKAGVEITKPEETVKAVIRANDAIPKGLEDDIFASFIKGGQLTAGGVMQAVTATAQTQPNADLAYELEAQALNVLASAARLA